MQSKSKFADIYQANLLKTGKTGKNDSRTDQTKILVAGYAPGSLRPRTVYCTGSMLLDSNSRIPREFLNKKRNWERRLYSKVWANRYWRWSTKWTRKKTEYVLAVYGTCCWTVKGRNGKVQKFFPGTPKKRVWSYYFQKISAEKC